MGPITSQATLCPRNFATTTNSYHFKVSKRQIRHHTTSIWCSSTLKGHEAAISAQAQIVGNIHTEPNPQPKQRLGFQLHSKRAAMTFQG